MPSSNHGSSTPSASFGRSILSFGRGQVHSMEANHEPTAQELKLESFQKLVLDQFHDLLTVNADELLSLAWVRKLLEAFMSCLEEFSVILSNNQAQISKPPMDRFVTEFFDRSVKALDVCNAIRDGIEKIRQWVKHLEIVLSALDSQRTLGEAQFRRARKALMDLALAMLDEKDTGSAFSQRNRSFGRHNTNKDRHNRSAGHSRSLSWSVSQSWSAYKQLQSIANNLVPPRGNEIVATDGLALSVFTMSFVLVFGMDPILPITVLSIFLGGLIALLLFNNYFRKRRSEVESISKPELQPNQKSSKNSQHSSKKTHSKSHAHHHASDKDQNKRHHPLDVNTLKGHGDSVTSVCFSSDGRSLATACADGVVRVFKMDDASSKSFKFLRIQVPAAGGHPAAAVFSDDASSVVLASQTLLGCSLYMYGEENAKNANDNKQQSKLPLPEVKWVQHKVHDKRAILTLVGTTATFGSADGSTIIASCSEGTDIKLWHGKTGRMLGNVDTNQLKNNMAAISPNGRFIAAAAFTADVKVWEIVYSKDGSVKEVSKAMQLKGHKSAVTWLCFSPNSEQIITASKDGSIRIWNINVRFHLDEDPKTLKVFPIPLQDSNGATLYYDRLSISPDGRVLAASHGSTLQWLCVETGKVLDTADKAHDGDITDIAWAPRTISMGDGQALILATASVDKKVKLWMAPPLHQS